MVKFAEAQNILDVLLKYEILEFCRFGFNRRKFLRTKTLDILPKNQISPNYRYIEIIKVFEIFGIIADIKLIHATYLIFTTTVKSESRRM